MEAKWGFSDIAIEWHEKQHLGLRGDSDMSCKAIYQARYGQAKRIH